MTKQRASNCCKSSTPRAAAAILRNRRDVNYRRSFFHELRVGSCRRRIMGAFGYRKPDDLPRTIPIFPLGGALLFPRGTLPLNIFEPRYLNMVDDALAGERLIGMIQPTPAGETADRPTLHDVGCLGRITSFSETDDGRYLINLTGVSRFRTARELAAPTPYRQIEGRLRVVWRRSSGARDRFAN
ncbi:MAG: LON peptidase substrate-binding domain-containing protein [Alphaproteobacteria bacterium]